MIPNMLPDWLDYRAAAVTVALASALAACSERPQDVQVLPVEARWTATEEIRISGEREQLVPFGSLAPGPNGSILIPQRIDGVVHLYDSAGRRLRTIGRPGPGPGELIEPARAGWKGDTVWVTRNRPEAVVFFNLNGEHLRDQQIRTLYTDDYMGQQVGFATGGGVHAVHAESNSYILFSIGVQHLPTVGASLAAFSANDELVKILILGGKSEFPTLNVPFQWRRLYAVSQDGMYAAKISSKSAEAGNGVFKVEMVNFDGDTLINRQYRVANLERITTAQSERLIGYINSTSAEPLPSTVYPLMPTHHQPYQYLLAAGDGTVWIQMRPAGDSALWVALDRNGDLLGSIRFPALLRINEVRGDRIWAMQEDPITGVRDGVVLKIVR